jgi:Galactose oxidase, central domain
MKPTGKRISESLKRSFVHSLVLLGVTGQVPLAMAQSPGTFTTTGNMTTGRSSHTATLLRSGKVLIAGGERATFASTELLASAELYDPSTGAFRPTGDMTAPRKLPTATLLADDRVLITGGYGPPRGGAIASAELYDPSTGTFTATGDMIGARVCHTATLLSNGKVLITGDKRPDTAELYDPATGTFTATGAYDAIGGCLTATLLPDGRVLRSGVPAQLYDSVSGTFSPAGADIYPYPITTT